MAMQSPFFGKRESDTLNSRPLSSGATPLNSPRAPQTHNAQGEANPAVAAQAAQAGSTAPRAEPRSEGGSKLTVGPNIKLKGVEITDCDTLVVEGTVEATMDSRVIEISERGAFKGSAEIDIAEIHGEFDGNLTVRQKLVIHSSGRVTGKIRYGKLIIEEGGQLAGEIECAAVAARLNPANRQMAQATA